MDHGGGFLALHDALDGPRGGLYEQLLGGSFVRHAGPYHIVVHVTDEGRKTPLMAGVRDFEVLEDQVFPVYTVDTPSSGALPAQPGTPHRGPAHVLMTGFAMDNTSDPERLKLRTNVITNPVAGWWQEIGKGRMCYLAIGGTTAGMNDPMMQKLYENALHWLGQER